MQMVGGAEAQSIEAIGKAEAERMRQKAAAYKQYGDAAMMSLILESLPKVNAVPLLSLVRALLHIPSGLAPNKH